MNQKIVKNNRYEIWGKNGWENFDGVIKNTDNKGIELIDIRLENESFISCTPDHKVSINENDTIPAKKLKKGSLIKTENDTILIKNINTKRKVKHVFDIWNSDSHRIYTRVGNTEPVMSSQCDELAFVPKHDADDFWSANYPTISASKTAKIIVISTPNGTFNLFHTLCSDAKRKKNSFFFTKVSWQAVPGRDEKWAEEQKLNMGLMKFNQEFAVVFLGSNQTVIDPNTLKILLNNSIEPSTIELNGRFRIYEKPKKDANYVLGVDPSKGTGEKNAAFHVLRIDSLVPVNMTQVATFYDNMTDVYTFSEIINRTALYYNNAWIMVENNGEGSAVVNNIWWVYENDRLVNSGTKEKNLGIRATKGTKGKAVLLMKKLIEDGSVKLNDKETVEELSSFIEENNRFFGKDKPDDCVTSLYWALYILEKDLFDKTFEFKKSEMDDDAWGILSDYHHVEEDWNWLTNINI